MSGDHAGGLISNLGYASDVNDYNSQCCPVIRALLLFTNLMFQWVGEFDEVVTQSRHSLKLLYRTPRTCHVIGTWKHRYVPRQRGGRSGHAHPPKVAQKIKNEK